MDPKGIVDTLLERRSVRRYTTDPITDEQLRFIYEAIRNTPTSYNGQQFSVIDIDDQDLKLKLYAEIGQKQIKTCAHFLVFCIDYHKIGTLAKARDIEMPSIYDTVDGLIIGTIDASLAMQNALVAAESCRLGTCPIGYARTAAPAAIKRLLQLPEHVFVVCGLAIGVPRETPDLKPKQPLPLLIHRNRYTEDNMVAFLDAYDEQISQYNRTRSGDRTDNDWLTHILSYYREALNYDMLQALHRCGFSPER